MSQEFEGQEISEFIAVIPSMKLEAPDSYQRGTYLTLNVEVRVRSVRYEEVMSGKHKGDLQKVHVLAIENVSVAETVTPQQRQAILEAAAKQLETAMIEDVDVIDAEIVSEGFAEIEAGPKSKSYTAEEKSDDWVYSTPEYVNNDDEDVAQARYQMALDRGLSDYEAREEGWPSQQEASVGF